MGIFSIMFALTNHKTYQIKLFRICSWLHSLSLKRNFK